MFQEIHIKGERMNFKAKLFFGVSLSVVTGLSLISCSKIEIPFFNQSAKAISRQLDGVDYLIITPENYAKKLKEGEIGTGEKFVIDGLCLGTKDNTLMLQKSGLTNIFTLEEPLELNMGSKVRIYVEVTLVNSILINLSEAKVIKIEKL
jgi:hypothetical protein